MEFGAVTILVGENGSGKSTLLEALARLMRLPAIGAADAGRTTPRSTPYNRSATPCAQCLRGVHGSGMFLRAEDFFGYTRRISALQAEMRAELERVDLEYANASAFTRGQARMAYAGSLYALNQAHGEDPDARSHGESFVHLFNERVHDGGLYLLDEPEAPLVATAAIGADIADNEARTAQSVHNSYPLADVDRVSRRADLVVRRRTGATRGLCRAGTACA